MDFIIDNISWVFLAVLSGGMLLWQTLRNGHNVSVADATLLLNREEAVVLDVRETNEWSAGHIPNARHVALGQLGKHLSELEKLKDRPLILCCASGARSSTGCQTLKKAGFEKVFSLAGGIQAWTDAGLPTTTKG